jgi:hypothetical protein
MELAGCFMGLTKQKAPREGLYTLFNGGVDVVVRSLTEKRLASDVKQVQIQN